MIDNAMKVMVLGIRGIPNVQGGVETHAEHLYAHLARLGCSVEALVRTPFVPSGRKLVGVIRLRRIWSPRTVGLEALVHSLLGVLYAGFRRPDVLHIHAIGPAIAVPIARLLGLRVVVTHHGPDYDRDKWGPFARFILRLGERYGMRYSHARIAISQVIVDLVRNKYGRESSLIPNGVSVADPCPETHLLQQHALEARRYFLLVSRMVPEKRQLDLIKAYSAARPAGWKLVLVGGLDATSYSREVETAARAAGVVLTGFLRGAPLAQMYSHAGAFVLPSSHEGLPIALLEALSYGVPVLASDIPANLEIGLDSSSYFPVGNISALAAALTRFATMPQDEDARAALKRRVTNAYDWNHIAERTLDVYRRVSPSQKSPDFAPTEVNWEHNSSEERSHRLSHKKD